MVGRRARLSIEMTVSPTPCLTMASLSVIQRTSWSMRVLERMNARAVPRRSSGTRVLVKTSLKAICRPWSRMRGREKMNAEAYHRRSLSTMAPSRTRVPAETSLKPMQRPWSSTRGREKTSAEVNHRRSLSMRVPKRLPLNKSFLARCSKDVGYRSPECVYFSRLRAFRRWWISQAIEQVSTASPTVLLPKQAITNSSRTSPSTAKASSIS